ncbi:MAG: CapA family protein [Oligoflexales bacterium]
MHLILRNFLFLSYIALIPCLGFGKIIEKPIKISAFGDAGIIFNLKSINSSSPKFIEERLKNINLLKSKDINFLNFEGSLSRSCKIFTKKKYTFVMKPEILIGFAKWGFNLFALANNHTLDCLDPNPTKEINKVFNILTSKNPLIRFHGIDSSAERLLKVATMNKNQIKVGMISIKEWKNSSSTSIGNFNNRKKLFRALKNAPVHIRILSLHGGIERKREPTDKIVQIAHEFVEKYDGDLVFAHHPHVLQGWEVLQSSKGKFAAIFYSLGNFLHTGMSPYGEGMGVQIMLKTKGIIPNSIKAFPLRNLSTSPRPIAFHQLSSFAAKLKPSMEHINSLKLPSGFKRKTFRLVHKKLPYSNFSIVFEKKKKNLSLEKDSSENSLVKK